MTRRINLRSTVLRPALAAALALGLALPALAQDEVNTPPQPNRGVTLTSPVGGYAIMALAAAAIVAVSLMPAKRGHQD